MIDHNWSLNLNATFPYASDNYHLKPKDYKIKKEEIVPEIFFRFWQIPEKLEDLNEVPFYLRDIISKIVDKMTK